MAFTKLRRPDRGGGDAAAAVTPEVQRTVQRKLAGMSGYAEQAAALAPARGKPAAGAQVTAGDASALSYAGPLGPYGPLGVMGPIGKQAWHASTAMGAAGDWSKQREQLTAAGGPLSEAGPLGPAGPVGEVDQRGAAVPTNLRPGGKAGALGAVGPLGALGPLGPLGPVGGHGYQADAEGNYRDAKGDVVRSVGVPYQGGQRHYDLVESYGEGQAKAMKDNDTSFMVSGTCNQKNERDRYTFTAKHGQMVTLCVVPEKQLDDFAMTVTDASGKVLYDSSDTKLVDNVQLKVKPGTTLTAEVRLKQSLHLVSSTYRLVVTGSSRYVKV